MWEDDGTRGVSIAIAAVLFCALLIGGIGFILSDAPDAPVDEPAPTYQLAIDCSNAALMHRYGMPTKADCMQYHLHGQWGYYSDGMLYAFDALPGSADAWDALYGIEDNAAFRK